MKPRENQKKRRGDYFAQHRILSGWTILQGLNSNYATEFLDDFRHMEHSNLAVELLERLLKDDIKSRFKTNVVQSQNR